MRGCLVTATDTEVGKTTVAAAVVAALAAGGQRVAAFKPVLTGVDETAPGAADDELLAAAAGSTREAVTPLRFGPAVSPHLAAELAGAAVDPAALVAAARAAADGADAIVVEGIGGLLVPLAGDYSVLDFARELGLPLVVVARPGLGTINHTLLTVAAARGAGLDVRAVVLTPWPLRPGAVERSNRTTIARLAAVDVAVLERVARPEPAALARAGAQLPYRRWLGP